MCTNRAIDSVEKRSERHLQFFCSLPLDLYPARLGHQDWRNEINNYAPNRHDDGKQIHLSPVKHPVIPRVLRMLVILLDSSHAKEGLVRVWMIVEQHQMALPNLLVFERPEH